MDFIGESFSDVPFMQARGLLGQRRGSMSDGVSSAGASTNTTCTEKSALDMFPTLKLTRQPSLIHVL
jgi:hypothetical protein